MGAGLSREAQVFVFPLLGAHHTARVALGVMAITAKDRDEHPMYFGGWRPIALALALSGTNDSQRSAVSRIWRTLREAGAIEAVSPTATRGRQTTTWLLLRNQWPGL